MQLCTVLGLNKLHPHEMPMQLLNYHEKDPRLPTSYV